MNYTAQHIKDLAIANAIAQRHFKRLQLEQMRREADIEIELNAKIREYLIREYHRRKGENPNGSH